MNTVVRVLPPGKLARARSYIARETDFGSGYIEFNLGRTQSTGKGHVAIVAQNPGRALVRCSGGTSRVSRDWGMTKLLHDDDFGAVDLVAARSTQLPETWSFCRDRKGFNEDRLVAASSRGVHHRRLAAEFRCEINPVRTHRGGCIGAQHIPSSHCSNGKLPAVRNTPARAGVRPCGSRC
jgi:hypothetical protein